MVSLLGDHFAFARDRCHPLPAFKDAKKGGCTNLADLAWEQGDRAALVQLLDLEGSYGRVSNGTKCTPHCTPFLHTMVF